MGCFSFLVQCLKKCNGGRDDILESLREQFVIVASFSDDVFHQHLKKVISLAVTGRNYNKR